MSDRLHHRGPTDAPADHGENCVPCGTCDDLRCWHYGNSDLLPECCRAMAGWDGGAPTHECECLAFNPNPRVDEEPAKDWTTMPDDWEANLAPRIEKALGSAHLRYLEDIRAMVNEMMALPMPLDEQVPDVLGVVRALERDLQTWRLGLKAETPAAPAAKGAGYKIAETREAKRNFNTAGLLHTILQGRTLDIGFLRQLIEKKVLRLEWLWAPRGGGGVKRYFSDNQLELRIVGREVSDGGDINEAHVGEVWSSDTEVQAVKP